MSRRTQIKFIILGDYSTGKTSLAHHFMYDSALAQSEPTIGVDFMLKKIIDKQYGDIDFYVWDTSGAEKFNTASLTQTYYRGANAIIFVFDITCLRSFKNITEVWMPRLQSARLSDDPYKAYLVANKCDLVEYREVAADDIAQFTRDYQIPYIELSSLYSTCADIRKPFIHLALQLIDDGVCRPTERDIQLNVDDTPNHCCSSV